MEPVKEFQNRIKELTKLVSLRQISIGSGINYLTLQNIKSGKTKRVSADVADRFRKFDTSLKTAESSETVPKEAAGKVEATSRKRGRKPGSKNKAVKIPASETAAKKQAARKPAAGRKSSGHGKQAVKPAESTIANPVTQSPVLLGDRLVEEIRTVEARLQYLRGLERVEAEYLRSLKLK